jgi:hypothetical protein
MCITFKSPASSSLTKSNSTPYLSRPLTPSHLRKLVRSPQSIDHTVHSIRTQYTQALRTAMQAVQYEGVQIIFRPMHSVRWPIFYSPIHRVTQYDRFGHRLFFSIISLKPHPPHFLGHPEADFRPGSASLRVAPARSTYQRICASRCSTWWHNSSPPNIPLSTGDDPSIFWWNTNVRCNHRPSFT